MRRPSHTPRRSRIARPDRLIGVVLLGLALSAGCAARSPAAEARQHERWVRDLSAPRDATREMSRAGLIAAGDAALPWLESEIRSGGRSASAALALLGEIATPTAIQILWEAREDPSLWAEAEAALQRADLEMRRALKREPTVALCEDYLALFPERASAPAVERLRRELLAREAAYALPGSSQDPSVARFFEEHGGTEAADRFRADRGGRAADRAREAIRQGDGELALGWIQEAHGWDPTLALTQEEATARTLLGERLSGEDLDAAIAQLEQAERLSGETPAELGALYLQRARVRFETGAFAEGIQDLTAAEEVEPPSAPLIAELRVAWAGRLLDISRARPDQAPELAEALYRMGEGGREVLEILTWERARDGDPAPLILLAALAPAEGDPWLTELQTRVRLEASAVLEEVLADPEELDALTGAEPWTEGAQAARARAAPPAMVWPALDALSRGVKPPSEASALQDLRRGLDPADPDLTWSARAVLVGQLAGRLRGLESLAQEDPARLIAPLVGRWQPPVDAADWTWVSAVAERLEPGASYAVVLSGGQSASLRAAGEGTMRVEVTLTDGAIDADDVAGDALTILFGAARPLFFTRPGLEQLDVVVLDADGGAVLRAGLSRRAVEHMAWSLVDSEAPFGPDHLGLVADHEIF